MIEKIKCIYSIKNIDTNDCYIGSTNDYYKRIKSHKLLLNKNKHHSIILQRAFNKYGINKFIFSIIKIVDIHDLIQEEQRYIDLLNPIYNINKKANSSLGTKRRQETIDKIRKNNLGLKHPQWRNELKSETQKGRKTKQRSEKARKNMSEAQKSYMRMDISIP